MHATSAVRMKGISAMLLCCFSCFASAGWSQVTLSSLLEEMVDRASLVPGSGPAYSTGQFSSYDRASDQAEGPEQDAWFANRDVGHYLRVEQRAGRTEHVMMDASGPGAIVRFWSANPRGTLRVYLDDAPEPVIEMPMREALSEGGLVPEPLAGVRAMGHNLHLPIPYAERCVVTSDAGGFYYIINNRTYEPGTEVESFRMEALERARDVVERTSEALLEKPQWNTLRLDSWGDQSSDIGVFFQTGPGVVTSAEVTVLAPAEELPAILRRHALEVEADGRTTVWVPLGAFFGIGTEPKAYSDWVREVEPVDGGVRMRAWFPMPYEEEITIGIASDQPVGPGARFQVQADSEPYDGEVSHFCAAWQERRDIPTRPFSDMNFITIEGPGALVADQMTITNPVPGWWGEGDEKIYIDGEAFPSHFGTGTEDYYGYAWCSPQTFQSPFHSQPHCEGEPHGNNYGTTTIARLRSLDTIPFRERLRFDMELWHWVDTTVSVSNTVFFYASPETTWNVAPSPEALKLDPPSVPALPEPLALEGAIEAEYLQLLESTPGMQVSPQGGIRPRLWSASRHLWIVAKQPGDFVTVAIGGSHTQPASLRARMTKAPDYGIVRILVNDTVAVEEADLFHSDGVVTEMIELGRHSPREGRFDIRMELIGSHPDSRGEGTFLGVDCFFVDR